MGVRTRFFVCIWLVGCGGCATTSIAQLNGLIGKSIGEATQSLGKAPSSMVDVGGGQKVYTWKWPIAGTAISTTGRTMHEVVTLWTDSNGRIVRYQRSAE